MTSMITKSLLAAAALTGTSLIALPASAMPVQHEQGASSLFQLSSWGDRVRGRTSSGNSQYGYGYAYERGYPAYSPYGYDRAPYGYDQAPVDYDGGYGYDAY